MQVTDWHRRRAARLVERRPGGVGGQTVGMEPRLPALIERGYLAAVERIETQHGGDTGLYAPNADLLLDTYGDILNWDSGKLDPKDVRAAAYEALVLADLAEHGSADR